MPRGLYGLAPVRRSTSAVSLFFMPWPLEASGEVGGGTRRRGGRDGAHVEGVDGDGKDGEDHLSGKRFAMNRSMHLRTATRRIGIIVDHMFAVVVDV